MPARSVSFLSSGRSIRAIKPWRGAPCQMDAVTRRGCKPPSTTSVCPRTISASGEQRNATAAAMSSGVTMRPAAFFAPSASISSRFGKWSRAPGLDDAARDGVDPDPGRAELDGEVADERTRSRPSRCRRGRSSRARAREPRLEIATIDEPARHPRGDLTGEREQRAGVRVQRPVPVLVLGLEGWADDARRGVVDEDVERAELAHLLEHPLGGDVAAHEHRLGAERAQLLCRLLGGRVRAHVADRDAGGALAREAKRDRLADPAGAAGDEDRPAHQLLRGAAAPTGAERRHLVPADPRARLLELVVLGLRRRVAEIVEQADLLLAVACARGRPRAAPRRARARAPGSGTRNAASPGRRGRRCRRRVGFGSAIAAASLTD